MGACFCAGAAGYRGFVRLTAQEPLELVGVETPVAAVGEIHEMKMEGDVMRMRAIDSLPLPEARPWSSSPVATT